MKVTKRKVSFALILMLVVAGLVMAMLPAAALAVPGIVEVHWSEASFEGNDAFYGGAAVVAYEAGKTAKMEFRVWNDSAVDMNITGGSLVLDWATCAPAAPTAFPFVLKAGEYAVFRFECVVPAEVSGQTLHSYRAIVRYENDNGPVEVYGVAYENLGPGGAMTYNLAHSPIVKDSETIYYDDPTTHTVTALPRDGGYTVNDYTGEVRFDPTAPPATCTVRAAYKYMETVINGDGVKKVGYLANKPAVAGSEVVYLVDTVANTLTQQAAGAYTLDADTGKVTMAVAPTAWQRVQVYYRYYNVLTEEGANLAVYSADQAAAKTLSVQLENLQDNAPDAWVPFSTGGAQALSESNILAAQADTKYAAGDFAGAKVDYQAAIEKINAAYKANSDLSLGGETAVSKLLTSASPVVDAYAKKLDAEAKTAEGQASMYKNVGVFTILLGVATLLAGLGGILWAYSRLVAAKGPKQQQM